MPDAPIQGEQGTTHKTTRKRRGTLNNVFYIIGVVVVVLAILGYFGFR